MESYFDVINVCSYTYECFMKSNRHYYLRKSVAAWDKVQKMRKYGHISN